MYCANKMNPAAASVGNLGRAFQLKLLDWKFTPKQLFYDQNYALNFLPQKPDYFSAKNNNNFYANF